MIDHLQAIITVLSLVNPFMCAAIFVQIEAGKSPGAQLGSATKVALPLGVPIINKRCADCDRPRKAPNGVTS